MSAPSCCPPSIVEALQVLGIRRLLLGIHDPAFPEAAGEDVGRGSPYGTGSRRLLRFARSLGFTGIQFGPQGLTSPINASPYDSTLFSRNPLSLALAPLTTKPWGELLGSATLDRLCEAASVTTGTDHGRVNHAQVIQRLEPIWGEIWMYAAKQLAAGTLGELGREFAWFQEQNQEWLQRDGLYEVLCRLYGGQSWRFWQGTEAELDRNLWWPQKGDQGRREARRQALLTWFQADLTHYAWFQFLLDRQHRQLREYTRSLGLDLFGDLQIGFSERDAWFAQPFLLPGYFMGAPPSRTNPEGQPWNYPVLDPLQYDDTQTSQPGPATTFFQRRLGKMLDEFDGLRIDHPHGLICPWVYRVDQADPLWAVQNGARLFVSPDLPDHPELARYAIPRPDQLNRGLARHDDARVRELSPEQVDRYGRLFAEVVQAVRSNGRDIDAIVCEILSTQPAPIRQVLGRYGLGRFRVTQKADLDKPDDVYRSENARPEDWIMLGNHDTPPIWRLVDQWQTSGGLRQQAEYLAWRLEADSSQREAWVQRLVADPGELVQAKVADLFAGPAGNVMIFFTDLFGNKALYNQPGVISDENWSLRIDADFDQKYRQDVVLNRAINIPRALALAIRSKGKSFAVDHASLLSRLDGLAVHSGGDGDTGPL
jgi:4-alpha-glucanotransferase